MVVLMNRKKYRGWLTLELPSLFLFAAVRLARSSPSSSAAYPPLSPQGCLLDRFVVFE